MNDNERKRPELSKTGHADLDQMAAKVFQRFQDKDHLLSFGDYLEHVRQHPERHVRSAAQYIKDTFDHFGTQEVQGVRGPVRRFKLFNMDFAPDQHPVHGQELIQNQIYEQLSSFAERGFTDKIIVLHGPNGTGKTSIISAIFRAMEHYSAQDEGALYTLNWVFSDTAERTSLGFAEKITLEPGESLAYHDAEELSCKLRCDLRDNPLLLIPQAERMAFLEQIFADKGLDTQRIPQILRTGDISHKSREIYNELLSSYHGDWARVMQHIQITRFFVSKRYRRCAITIEPQRNIDASSRTLSLERSLQLPPILMQANIHQLHGDLVDGNRGLVEYSDFFKRPMEVNKYLLTTSEQGTVSLGSTMAYLDVVLMASSNEKHLNIFKVDPDFSSFKARMELVRVPYLLQWSKEASLFKEKIQAMARGKTISPHANRVMGLWAVLTRLRRPMPEKYPSPLSELVRRLSAVDKAKLYDTGQAPSDWSDSDRRELLAGLKDIASEFDDAEDKFEGIPGPEYEGRRGVSVRELLSVINEAALNDDYSCLSPLSLFEALRSFCKDRSLHDFMRFDVKKTYGDVARLIDFVEEEYRRWIVEEVHDCTDLIGEGQVARLFNDYFAHVKAWKNKEKVINSQTAKAEDPNNSLMADVEEALSLPSDQNIQEFRSGLILRIAGWAIENPGQSIPYKKIFSDIFEALKKHTYERRSGAVKTIQQNVLKYGTDEWKYLLPNEQQVVESTLKKMCDKYGYNEAGAKEVLSYILSQES